MQLPGLGDAALVVEGVKWQPPASHSCRPRTSHLRAPQMPLAVDSAGSCLLLAFAPLELRVVRVELERAAGAAEPGGQQAQHSARLTTLRELSIMGMSSPLQVGLC